ncbi:hypothetical protein KCU91_g15336, partial [Aureobasidium melanogenum]
MTGFAALSLEVRLMIFEALFDDVTEQYYPHPMLEVSEQITTECEPYLFRHLELTIANPPCPNLRHREYQWVAALSSPEQRASRQHPKSKFLFYEVFDTTIANTYESTVGHTVFPFSDRPISSSLTATVAPAIDATVDPSPNPHREFVIIVGIQAKDGLHSAPTLKRQDFQPTHAALIERLEKRYLWKVPPALQIKIDAIVLPNLTSAEFSTGPAAYAQHYLWVFENGCLWIGKAETDGRIFDSPESSAHSLQALEIENLSRYSDNLEELLQASRIVDGDLRGSYIMEIWAIVDMFPCLHVGVYPDSPPLTRIVGPVLTRRAGPCKFSIWAIMEVLQEPLPDYILVRFDAASIELFIEDFNGCKKHLLGLDLKHNTIRYIVNGAPDQPVEKAEGYVTMPAKPYWEKAELTRKLDKFLFVHDLSSGRQKTLVERSE